MGVKSGDKGVLKPKTDGKKKKLHQVVKSDVNSDNLIQNDRKSKRRSYKDAVKSDKDRKFKKSSDIVKSENEAKSDNENQGEWTVVGEKKKKGKKQSEKGKSDKNVVVEVMRSGRGNYWIIKKKN